MTALDKMAISSPSSESAELEINCRIRPETTSTGSQIWVLLVVLIVGIATRVAMLNHNGLWADEVFSLAMATGHSLEHPAAAARPELGDFVEPNEAVSADEFRRYTNHETPPVGPGRVLRAVLRSDSSPPLYYLLLYGWTRLFGTTDSALRLFSTLCWTACFPFFVSIARQVGGQAAVIAGSVLFAWSPLAIYYSTEGRMYALTWLCIIAVTWASIKLQEQREPVGLYSVWIVASAAGLLTHYFFLFPWLAIVGYLLGSAGKLRRLHLLGCMAMTVVLILPWYAKLPGNASNWRITQGWLKSEPEHFNRLVASLDFVTQFFSGHARDLWLSHRVFHIAAIMLFAGVAVAMARRLRSRLWTGVLFLLLLVFAAACVGPMLVDLVQHTFLVAKTRYAVAGLPAACLLAAAGLACLRTHTRAVVLSLIVIIWTPNVLSIYRQGSPWLPMREIARAATENSSASDLMLVHSVPSGVLDIARYADGPAAMASWVQQLGDRQTPESLHTLARGKSRILFVKVHEAGAPAPEEDWLRTNAIVVEQKRLGLGTIVDFRPKNAATF